MVSEPGRRADAARNRARILAAARDAFADGGADTSMAEVARRSGVGQATLYRNFATRRDLLEAVFAEEVDQVCAAADGVNGDTPIDQLTNWLRRFYQYVADKRPIVMGLLDHTNTADPIFKTRTRMLTAAQPLLAAAKMAREVNPQLELDQILDMVMAIAKINGTADYRQPILDAALAGLRFPN